MQLLKLKDVCSVNSGISPPKDKKIFENGTIPFYKTLDVGRVKAGDISDSELKVSQEFADSKRVFEPGTILFPKSGASTLLNHRVMIQKKGLVASTLAAIVPIKDLCLSKYLYYYLLTIDTKDFIPESFYPGMKISEISEIPIPVPSRQEQEKIVERLDKVFKNIDKASVAKENEMLSLTNLFDSFLDNKIEEFGESEQKLGEYYDVRDGTHDSPKYYEKGYPLITSKNLKDGQLNFEKIKFISEEDFNKINERSKVNKGDVLMAMIGTIGNPVVIKDNSKFAIKNVALFKLNKNQSSEYLYYFLRSNKVKKKMMAEAKGTTQKFVGLGYLRNFTITGKFDLNAENEVVFLISKIENIVNALINNQQQIYTKLLELKKSVLKKEFSYE